MRVCCLFYRECMWLLAQSQLMEEKPNCDQHYIGKIELPNRIEKQGSTALNVASTLGMHKLYVNRFQPVGQKLFYEAFNGLGKPIYFKRAHLIAKRCIP